MPLTVAVIEAVLERVSGVDLARRVTEVQRVAGPPSTVGGVCPATTSIAADGAGEVAGGVERDAAVQADDHEGKERLVEPAARVGPGRDSPGRARPSR